MTVQPSQAYLQRPDCFWRNRSEVNRSSVDDTARLCPPAEREAEYSREQNKQTIMQTSILNRISLLDT